LQQKIGQLQINLASAQARHKEDAQKLEASRRESLVRITAPEQEITSQNDHINCTEQEIQALKRDVHNKHTEVCMFADHLNI